MSRAPSEIPPPPRRNPLHTTLVGAALILAACSPRALSIEAGSDPYTTPPTAEDTTEDTASNTAEGAPGEPGERMTWGELGERVLAFLLPPPMPEVAEVSLITVEPGRVMPAFDFADLPPEAAEGWAAFSVGRWKDARGAFSAFVEGHPEHPRAGEAHYLLGWLEDRAGHRRAASHHYGIAATRLPDLSSMARARGARAALRGGRASEALELLGEGPLRGRFAQGALRIRAQALAALKRYEDALEALDVWLASGPGKRSRLSGQLSRAGLLRRLGRDAEAAHALHALWRRHPGTATADAALGQLKSLKKSMGKKAWRALGPDLSLGRAAKIIREGWLNLGRDYARRIHREVGRLLRKKKGGLAVGGPLWCDAWWLMARAHKLRRDHDEQARAWRTFIEGCGADARISAARFALGRALWNQDLDDEALAIFGALHTEHPEAPEADDALLNASTIHRRHERPEEARQLIARLLAEYPEGDKATEAQWLHMSDLMARGEWAEAAWFARSVQQDDAREGSTLSRPPLTRARMQYFEVRALELSGRTAQAVDGYRAVIRNEPMGYYALLALNRLQALRPDTFAEEYQALIAATGKGVAGLTLPHRAWMSDPGFAEALALMRLGLMTEARRAFTWLRRRYRAGDEVRWLAAHLFAQAGARGHADDILAHEVRSVAGGWPVGPLKARFHAAFPQPFEKDVEAWTTKRELPAPLLYAVMRVESGFNPKVVSWARACGLMQMLVPTAQRLARDDGVKRWKRIGCGSLKRPSLAIRLGSRFLSWLMTRNQGHPALAAAGYHAGQGNVNKWLRRAGHLPFDVWMEQAPFPRTRRYIRRVITTMWTYQWLQTPEGADAPLVRLPMHLDHLATR